MVEDDVVERQDAGPRQRQGEHRLVVAVVAHLVERQAGAGGRRVDLDQRIARGERRIDRLAGQVDEPQVGRIGERGEGRQQVGDVVGDPGADGRQRRDEVEA